MFNIVQMSTRDEIVSPSSVLQCRALLDIAANVDNVKTSNETVGRVHSLRSICLSVVVNGSF